MGERLARIGGRRRAFIARELRLLGYGEAAAGQLGTALYLALIGLYAARRHAPDLAQDERLLALLDFMISGVPAARRKA